MMNGWHEVRLADPLAGGELLAALVAMQYDNIVWIQSPQAAINIFNLIDWSPRHIFCVDRIDYMFSVAKQVHEYTDLVVVDNLAQFSPAHPQNVLIAGDIKRNWFMPKCPILVLNQVRVPYPPGGSFWRTHLRTKQTLSSVETYPDLCSQLCPDGRWLIWERSKGGCPRFGHYYRKEPLCKVGVLDWPFLVEELANAKEKSQVLGSTGLAFVREA